MRKRCEKTGIYLKTLKNKKCQQCVKTFRPNGIQRKFCSQQCYWNNKKGQPSKKKNGKFIKCNYCKKEFYISKSRFNKKKYCSKECGEKDKWGFKPKKKECIICHKDFVINSQLQLQKKTCSHKCWYENCKNLQKIRKQKQEKKQKKDWKSFKNGKSVSRGLHSRACYNYRKKFKEKHSYLFCENCKVNINGTPRFETHHIVFASEAPKHKELHNNKNLIVLCTKCHHLFHSKKGEARKDIVIKRGLEKLFDRKLYNRDINEKNET